MNLRSEVLFIGGRSGVGKSTVAAEMFAQLAAAGVEHCLIEGDNLDMAHPPPWRRGHRLAEANLAAMWANYKAIGHSRLIYANTASVYEDAIRSLVAAMGDDPVVHAVLLVASDDVADRRLAHRELGSGLALHSKRGREGARELEALAPPWIQRFQTDRQPVIEIARRLVDLVGWEPQAPGRSRGHRTPLQDA